MEFLSPTTLDEALAAMAEHPDAVPILGGTDVMVELNFDRRRPPALLDLTRVEELATWDRVGEEVRLGAGVTYARVIDELATELPGLALASRTVGSPQIRNRGTVGGNLGAASPAGDSPPGPAGGLRRRRALLARRRTPAAGARVLHRAEAARRSSGRAGHRGRVRAATGPQQFSKIGTRNAMVIAVAAFGLALHPDRRSVGTGIGSAGPTPRRATEAEELLAAELDWEHRGEVSDTVVAEFGRLVAAAAAPIDDVRGTAAYRRHALAVMARRCLGWAWADHRRGEAA